jgi:colanic acid biosynthesis glycosyl transferase WcaI
MRILLLSTYFRPESATNAILMTLISEELTRQGHQVTVITGMPHYDNNSVWPEYRGKLWKREQHGEIRIHRVYLYVPSKKTSMVGRLLNYLSFNVTSTLAGLLVGRHDVLLVPSPPLTNGVTGWLLSRLHRIPFIYNVQDIYPDVAVRLGVLKSPRVIRLFERMELFVYRKAKAVSVISDSFQRNLARKGMPTEKIRIIPNFIDTDFVKPLPRCNAFSQEHQLNDRFVVLFAGNVGLSQGLESVIDAAHRLQHIPEIQFLIVGNGSSKAALIERAAQLGLQNVLFLPLQPYDRVPELYSAADVCLIPLRRGLTEDSVPSKLFSIMGVARPVIASVDRESDTYKVIAEAGCGLCTGAEEPQELADAVLTLYHDRTQALEMGRRGRAYVEQHYTCVSVARKYSELFTDVTQKGIRLRVGQGDSPLHGVSEE